MAQNVKTLNGLAIASVKTFRGLAIASVKTINGVDNTGGGLASFSDDFIRADSDSLGSNWTEIAGDIDIVSNQANAPATFDFSEKAAVYTGTACTTVDQYVKVTFPSSGAANTRPGIIVRFTNSSSPYYEIRFQMAGPGSTINWYVMATAGGSETLVDFVSSFDDTLPGTVGLTVSGTGTSTVINLWNNPSANAPTSDSLWDGSGPTASLTGNPASPVDTGNYAGIAGIGSSGAITWSAFFGGDTP